MQFSSTKSKHQLTFPSSRPLLYVAFVVLSTIRMVLDPAPDDDAALLLTTILLLFSILLSFLWFSSHKFCRTSSCWSRCDTCLCIGRNSGLGGGGGEMAVFSRGGGEISELGVWWQRPPTFAAANSAAVFGGLYLHSNTRSGEMTVTAFNDNNIPLLTTTSLIWFTVCLATRILLLSWAISQPT